MGTRAKGGFYFILPSVIILGIFGVAVTVMNVGFSLTKWSALASPVFNGLSNYKRFFTDKVALTSLLNTFYYALLYVFPTVVISLLLALLLNSQSRIMSFFRALYYVPVITSYVIVIVVWQWIFDYDIGLLNQIGALFGAEKIPWLLSKKLAMPSIVIMSIWKNVGYSTLMFLAGLQTVDGALLEAARIDGASSVRTFFSVTLPELKPTISLAVVMVTTWAFQMFVQPYMMTQGGPDYATNTITYYLYQQAFSSYNIGYGSAIATIGVSIFLVIVQVEKYLLREKD